MPSPYTIRAAHAGDLDRLPEIERQAARRFARLPAFAFVAAMEPTSRAAFDEACRDERLWVAADSGGHAVGFALAERLDGCAHLAEMDVLLEHGRQGLGQALVEAVCAWAPLQGLEAVTLTTFRAVPWNAPYYERLGFQEVPPEGLTPGLRALVEAEAERGLERDSRVVMRYEMENGD